MSWLLTLADQNMNGLTRIIRVEHRDHYGVTIKSDASPWGGGALMWRTWAAYQADDPADEYLQIPWNNLHERLVSGRTGVPDFQADWEALMFVISLKTWTDTNIVGKVTVIGDAAGVISDLVAMKAKAKTINNLVKETALHLAPLGLELDGLHVWAEHNTHADELSRCLDEHTVPRWITTGTTTRATPTSCQSQVWSHCTAVSP